MNINGAVSQLLAGNKVKRDAWGGNYWFLYADGIYVCDKDDNRLGKIESYPVTTLDLIADDYRYRRNGAWHS